MGFGRSVKNFALNWIWRAPTYWNPWAVHQKQSTNFKVGQLTRNMVWRSRCPLQPWRLAWTNLFHSWNLQTSYASWVTMASSNDVCWGVEPWMTWSFFGSVTKDCFRNIQFSGMGNACVHQCPYLFMLMKGDVWRRNKSLWSTGRVCWGEEHVFPMNTSWNPSKGWTTWEKPIQRASWWPPCVRFTIAENKNTATVWPSYWMPWPMISSTCMKKVLQFPSMVLLLLFIWCLWHSKGIGPCWQNSATWRSILVEKVSPLPPLPSAIYARLDQKVSPTKSMRSTPHGMTPTWRKGRGLDRLLSLGFRYFLSRSSSFSSIFSMWCTKGLWQSLLAQRSPPDFNHVIVHTFLGNIFQSNVCGPSYPFISANLETWMYFAPTLSHRLPWSTRGWLAMAMCWPVWAGSTMKYQAFAKHMAFACTWLVWPVIC